MTSEHYFQAQKFYGTEYVEIIRLLDNPMKAAKMGRNRNLPLREDWEEVKDDVMRKAVYAKFSQNIELKTYYLTQIQNILWRIHPMIIIGDVEQMALEKIC